MRGTIAITAGTAMLFTMFTGAIPASAAETKSGKVNTHGPRLWIRSGTARTHHALGSLKNHTKVRIICQAIGEPITGTYGTSALWDRIGPGRYVSDAFVYTGSDRRVAPWCHGNKPAGSPKQTARKLLPKYGWTVRTQFPCLDDLWTKESGWNPRARNPSGAYGIPQALPAAKMASAGSEWRTNPATQIRWGLGYITSRYGTPCAARAHSQKHNWY